MSEKVVNRPFIKKLYRKAINHWGLELQYGMLIEECAELIQATNKILRRGDITENWDNFAEEIADVEIMLDQLKTIITWQNLNKRVEEAKIKKLIRLNNILEKEVSSSSQS